LLEKALRMCFIAPKRNEQPRDERALGTLYRLEVLICDMGVMTILAQLSRNPRIVGLEVNLEISEVQGS
jgi:hypothetical protein